MIAATSADYSQQSHDYQSWLQSIWVIQADISWGECDVRLDPTGSELILRHDSFVDNPLDLNEEWLSLNRLLERLHETGKSVKFDMKAGGAAVDKVLQLVDAYDFDDSRLWVNGNVERLQEQGFRMLARAHPKAV